MTRCIGFDLETTGVDSFHDVPVSYGFVERPSGSRESLMESGYVNPSMPIPSGASAIHGISDEMVVDATPLPEAVELIAERLSAHWAHGDVIVGMNVAYDITMIDALSAIRARDPLRTRRYWRGRRRLVLDRHFDKWRKGEGN